MTMKYKISAFMRYFLTLAVDENVTCMQENMVFPSHHVETLV